MHKVVNAARVAVIGHRSETKLDYYSYLNGLTQNTLRIPR